MPIDGRDTSSGDEPTRSGDLGIIPSVLSPGSLAAGRMADTWASSEDVIEACLRALRQHFEMDVAFVGRVDGNRRVFDFVDSDSADCPVRAGESDPLEDSYCGRIIAGTIPQLIPDARAEPGVADIEATRALPVGAHLSVPLHRSTGEVMGTLCCFSHEPDAELRERDLRLMMLFADIVRSHLQRLLDSDRERAAREASIRKVLDRGGPAIAMQPIVHIETGQIRGFEALSRFPSGPGWTTRQWFSEADRVGLGVELEASAIAAALATLPRLPGDTVLTVNASPQALRSSTVMDQLTGSQARRLIVELTEHTRIDDYHVLTDELTVLRAAGARLAVDDAGSGWAGLEHILLLQPEVLKLDRALVTDVDHHTGRQAMVEAMAGFAERMGAVLVAEGVETADELTSLTSLGVEYAQGYLLGEPSLEFAS